VRTSSKTYSDILNRSLVRSINELAIDEKIGGIGGSFPFEEGSSKLVGEGGSHCESPGKNFPPIPRISNHWTLAGSKKIHDDYWSAGAKWQFWFKSRGFVA
jgi:hypothetical protein